MGKTYRPEAPSLWSDEGGGRVRYEPSPHQQPPYTVLDAAGGWWQQRRAYWQAFGCRDAGNRPTLFRRGPTAFAEASGNPENVTAESQFSPVLAELLLAFYTETGDAVWDPFCGGPVRGFVADAMGRAYEGVDVREDQVDANHAAFPGLAHLWRQGDARLASPERVPRMVFTCPPYHDVERYSEQPDDLSTLGWDEFCAEHERAVGRAAAASSEWVVWAVGDFRSETGELRGFPDLVAQQMRSAGLLLWNRHVVRQTLVTAPMRWRRTWDATRKATTTHSEVLVGRKARE